MRYAALLVFVAGALLTGCPEGAGEGGGGGAVDECTEVGQQCRLRDGLLGVCTPNDSTDCEAPPCLSCVGQH